MGQQGWGHGVWMGVIKVSQSWLKGVVSDLTWILMAPGFWDGPLVTLNIDSVHPVAVNGPTRIHFWCSNPFGSDGPCLWKVSLVLLPSQGFMDTVGHRACSGTHSSGQSDSKTWILEWKQMGPEVIRMTKEGSMEVTNTKQPLKVGEKGTPGRSHRSWDPYMPCKAEGCLCEIRSSRVPVRSLEGWGLLMRVNTGGSLVSRKESS